MLGEASFLGARPPDEAFRWWQESKRLGCPDRLCLFAEHQSQRQGKYLYHSGHSLSLVSASPS